MAKEKQPQEKQDEEAEIQLGEDKSIAKQEALKHIRKQHPGRDIPRVDEDRAEEEK